MTSSVLNLGMNLGVSERLKAIQETNEQLKGKNIVVQIGPKRFFQIENPINILWPFQISLCGFLRQPIF